MNGWSDVQLQRLRELEADHLELELRFESTKDRDKAFQVLEKKLIRNARVLLKQFRDQHLRPGLCRLESKLTEALTAKGFVQVATPTIMSRGLLARMTIDEKHPLFSQVFWLDRDRCLRPMLAPHLYYVLKDLLRLWERPVKIFEVGSCFRKESQGSHHSTEFTMLNLVEMGLPLEERHTRLKEFAALIAETTGLKSYDFETEISSVYGETIDITAGEDNIEVGSAAMGPHPLDNAWRITENWVGIGFGLERLLMARHNSSNLSKMGRSLTYLNGIRLNI